MTSKYWSWTWLIMRKGCSLCVHTTSSVFLGKYCFHSVTQRLLDIRQPDSALSILDLFFVVFFTWLIDLVFAFWLEFVFLFQNDLKRRTCLIRSALCVWFQTSAHKHSKCPFNNAFSYLGLGQHWEVLLIKTLPLTQHFPCLLSLRSLHYFFNRQFLRPPPRLVVLFVTPQAFSEFCSEVCVMDVSAFCFP